MDRIFCGVFPTGLSYADRQREKGGDWARLAHLSFATLELSIAKDCPAKLAAWIRQDAAKIQARRGEPYQISGAGQTVTLGFDLPTPRT